MNIGILGTGSIARTMAAEFAKVPAFRCEAVCSRQQATGEALAQQFGIPKVYTDYDAMLADPDIELVYIATPNSLHYAQTKAALLAGKNVLCEKPFVPTVAEADELIALAKEKHLFLFEAITTAHHPNYALAKQYLDTSGILLLEYPDFICQCTGAKDCAAPGSVQLIGDAGRILIEPGSSNCQKLRLVRPGQEDICSEYSESPWFYEVAEIAMILALKDYDACYAALKKTRQVVTVLEAAREDAQLGF